MNPKKILISTVTFISGLYFFLEWLLPEKIGDFEARVPLTVNSQQESKLGNSLAHSSKKAGNIKTQSHEKSKSPNSKKKDTIKKSDALEKQKIEKEVKNKTKK